ncbi:MAG: type II toxin-antitoxin system RelE/ParE family toxin [Lachnospiraceae bacterium]|jgi:plasmid stabilization system protein ParE|nr:type II toxin-antitoxin system RelE/ParE family toxin [Lachnospiraceae bacterium]
MPQSDKVRFLQEALDDAEEIVLYIAQDDIDAALRMHDRIIERAGQLALYPRLGRPVPDQKMRDAGFRLLVVKPYILFYRDIDGVIYIYRVLHGAMQYPALYDSMLQKITAPSPPPA